MMRNPFEPHCLVAISLAVVLGACSTSDPASGGGTGGAGTGGTGSGGTGGGSGGSLAGSGGSGGGSGGSTGGTGGGSDGSSGSGGADAGVVTDAPAGDRGGAVDGPGGGEVAVMASEGCGKPAGQALGSYIRKMPTGMNRIYDLYVPMGYDPMRPYRLIFLGHGCDGSIPFPMQQASGTDAILVAIRSRSSQATGQMFGGGCFDTGPGSSSLTEIPYFDQVLTDVSTNYCVDKARVFFGGYSSGSWLANLLGCVKAGVIKGQGNVAGGLPTIPACTGPVAAMLIHDVADDQNRLPEGEKARDRILQINGCSTQTMPYDFDDNPATPSVCVQYQGCKPGFPVVWCPTTGRGHSNNVPLSTVGLWRFWSKL